jgi:hypothetical protein
LQWKVIDGFSLLFVDFFVLFRIWENYKEKYRENIY